ncbi:MAG: protein kinase [Bryobacteraceae bacterium]
MPQAKTTGISASADKWREMWRICEEARQISPADRQRFLHSKGLEPEMERDVISLLMEPAESIAPSWGASSDSWGLGGGTAVAPARNLVGARVGRYVVEEQVGRGGGGEVYSAQDTDLDRKVALKFLHPGRVEARWTVDRFLREAKAASALNHPGIITVHEVIQSESGLAIAMEFVDGQSLRKLCGAPNPVSQVIRWGAQIADALAAAHGRGIIHRDVKPENLMLRSDGFVKILDFGLAESLGSRKDPVTELLPAGTLRYMSPEQAMGGQLTPATDVFSLGIVLYELATGRHPFPAETALDALRAITSATPAAPSTLVREIPRPLETLILRMLEKDPGKRPEAGEVAQRLEGLRSAAQTQRPRTWSVLLGTAAAAVALAGGYLGWRGTQKAGPLTLSPIPLTDTAGVESHPDVSPDGESIVYGWGAHENAHTHLYVKRLDRDEPFKLLEAEHGERVSNPRWSPDGNRILFKSSAPVLQYALWSVAKDGTDRRKIRDLRATDHSSGLDWAPDGRHIVYTDRSPNAGNRYVVRWLDLSTMEDRELSSPPQGTWGDWDPRVSPDGSQVAFKRVTGISNDQIFVVPVAGGAPVPVTKGRLGISGHTWLPDGRLLAGGKFSSSINSLWSMDAKAGAAPELVHRSGLDEVMPSARKSRIAWVNRLDDHNIYAVPTAGGTPTRWIASAMYDGKPAVASDGRIAFVSRRSGEAELWISRPKGVDPARITDLKAEITRPAWSPDGTGLLFSVEGSNTLYLVRCGSGELRCGAPTSLTAGESPSWSGDGKSIYFNGPNDEIWRISAEGGAPQSTGAFGRDPVASTDGKWLYYRQVKDGLSLARLPLDGSGRTSQAEEVLVDRMKSANREHWTVAGAEVIYWDNDTDSKFSGLRAYNTVTRRSRTIIEGPAMYPTVSPDGATVFYSKRDRSGVNVMVSGLGR